MRSKFYGCRIESTNFLQSHQTRDILLTGVIAFLFPRQHRVVFLSVAVVVAHYYPIANVRKKNFLRIRKSCSLCPPQPQPCRPRRIVNDRAKKRTATHIPASHCATHSLPHSAAVLYVHTTALDSLAHCITTSVPNNFQHEQNEMEKNNIAIVMCVL